MLSIRVIGAIRGLTFFSASLLAFSTRLGFKSDVLHYFFWNTYPH